MDRTYHDLRRAKNAPATRAPQSDEPQIGVGLHIKARFQPTRWPVQGPIPLGEGKLTVGKAGN